MGRRIRWCLLVVCGMLLAGVMPVGAVPTAADPSHESVTSSEVSGDSVGGSPTIDALAVRDDAEDPSVPAPHLFEQFAYLQLHGDPLGFHLGVGDDPMTCRHYQGLARVDGADGTPYMILTRSGNTTWVADCSADSKNYPGELLIVEMGSRTDGDGERLRSNRLSLSASMGETIPPVQDRGVAHFHFDGSFGETAPGVSDGPKFSHLGGIQVVDDVLVVPLEEECTGGYSGDCNSDLTERGAIALIDVSDPKDPELLHWQYMSGIEKIGVAGVAYVGSDEHPSKGGRYLFVLTWGDSTDLRFAWSDTGDLRTTTTLQLEPFAWNEDMLGAYKDEWRNWQMLNLVRDPAYPGVLGLIGAEKTGTNDPRVGGGDDMLGLFALNTASISVGGVSNSISYLLQKHLKLTDPYLGNLDAASGVYVSPSGQLILYTAAHDNYGPPGGFYTDGGTVQMGEFRNIDVYQAGTEAVDRMCPWVELYKDSTGWTDSSPNRSLMLDFEDRNKDSWYNLEGEAFGDETSSLRWYRAPGQAIALFEDDSLGGSGLALHLFPADAVLWLDDLEDLSWGDRISSVKMFPYADAGGPYTGIVGVPVSLHEANPCLTAASAAPPVEFTWTVDSAACVFADPTARQPQLTCTTAGTFDVSLQVLSAGEWPYPLSAITEVSITEQVNHPPVAEGFSVSVLEDVAVGTTLGMVSASDADGESLVFAITAGNDDGLFTVAATTGRISLAAPLDYETDTKHILTVAVSDGLSTTSVTVTVLVLDVVELPEPGDTFIDDDDSIFEADIERLARSGITKGCGPMTFCPDDFVTRGQMAAFLVRALGYSDDGGGDLFSDDDASVFEGDIDRLATAGVTRGCNPPTNTEFCPDGLVTRGQMAAFLVRALGYSDDGGGDLFTDDDASVFEGDIDRLATAGVTRGCNPPANSRFCPDDFVTRGQMAAFLHRALGD